MNNKLIMQSLPLVVAVLGSKYGVKVEIGGTKAYTDGKTIHLPGLPLDCDKTLIGLARGYIDHESAHIRETDFRLLQKAKLTPLEMNVWNSIEDWRVEGKLANLFYGCRTNFNWLIRHFFMNGKIDDANPANLIPDWVLLTVRSWDVIEVGTPLDGMESIIDNYYPELVAQLKSIMQEVRAKCDTTCDSILYAKKIVSHITNHTKDSPHPKKQNDANSVGRQSKNKSQRELEQLIDANMDDLPKNMVDILADDLGKNVSCDPQKRIRVAVIGNRIFKGFSPESLQEINRSSVALKTRLHSILQAKLLKLNRIARHGKINTHKLHKIAIADPEMFIKHEEKTGFNTAVHILVDCSGSMRKRMDLTTKACYTLAKTLSSVNGINIGVTAFPAKPPNKTVDNDYRVGVYPILKHGESIHSKFYTKASGCTPMGEATWWVLQQLLPLKESRKIVLILTDGSPDCFSNMKNAIDHGRMLGIEFYGIGIDNNTITAMLPQYSCTIKELSDLAPSMFEIMKNALIK